MRQRRARSQSDFHYGDYPSRYMFPILSYVLMKEVPRNFSPVIYSHLLRHGRRKRRKDKKNKFSSWYKSETSITIGCNDNGITHSTIRGLNCSRFTPYPLSLQCYLSEVSCFGCHTCQRSRSTPLVPLTTRMRQREAVSGPCAKWSVKTKHGKPPSPKNTRDSISLAVRHVIQATSATTITSPLGHNNKHSRLGGSVYCYLLPKFWYKAVQAKYSRSMASGDKKYLQYQHLWVDTDRSGQKKVHAHKRTKSRCNASKDTED